MYAKRYPLWFCIDSFKVYFFFRISSSLAGISSQLTRVRYRGRQSSATHSYQCVQCFPVSKHCYGCQCLGFLTCAQLLMYATAHEGCTDTDCTRGLYGRRLHTRAVRSPTAHEGCTVTDCTRGLYGHRLHTRAVRSPTAHEGCTDTVCTGS